MTDEIKGLKCIHETPLTEFCDACVEGFGSNRPSTDKIPDGYELFEGKLMKVLNGERWGWWRFHNHYDRDGYCDNPGRGY